MQKPADTNEHEYELSYLEGLANAFCVAVQKAPDWKSAWYAVRESHGSDYDHHLLMAKDLTDNSLCYIRGIDNGNF